MQETGTATQNKADNKGNTHGFPLPFSELIRFVAELTSRYEIKAIQPILHVCESAAIRVDLNVAVLGRFNAGKSSFINHFIGRELLPVGVIPVTSVITELYGSEQDQAQILFLDGHTELVDLTKIKGFIAESENPGNVRAVSSVRVAVPELEPYAGLRFIDTPGLESVQSHNTEVSLAWAPNVDLALVAIGVDPPLSQQEITLIRRLFEYTPRICVLLTKVDILTEQEREEVLHFVSTQLNRNFECHIDVFPYSIRPAFEHLKLHLKRCFIDPALGSIREQKQKIINHKLHGLLRECGDYLQLTLRSAEMLDVEKQQLRERIPGEKNGLSDTKLELQLIARHNIGAARQHIEKTLLPFEKTLQQELRAALEADYSQWRLSFARMLDKFDSWLRNAMTTGLNMLSFSQKAEFLKPLRDAQRQQMQVLQAFRDRLSTQTLELFGVPLRTTEPEIEPEPPKIPDIKVGRIFDHNWELLSAVIPMTVFRRALKTRFGDRIDYETTKNLFRLTTQWTDVVAASITLIQREAEGRLNDLIKTVEHLTSATTRAPEIALDLERIHQAQAKLQA